MSQINTTWEINGNTFDLDLQDVETAEKYEQAFENMGINEKNIPKSGKNSEIIKGYYNMFVKLYDDLFGVGAGVKILGEKANSRICDEAYESFLNFIRAQTDASLQYRNTILTKYSPNRAQRRAQKTTK